MLVHQRVTISPWDSDRGSPFFFKGKPSICAFWSTSRTWKVCLKMGYPGSYALRRKMMALFLPLKGTVAYLQTNPDMMLKSQFMEVTLAPMGILLGSNPCSLLLRSMGKSSCPGLVRDGRPHTLLENWRFLEHSVVKTKPSWKMGRKTSWPNNPRLLTGGMHPHLWLCLKIILKSPNWFKVLQQSKHVKTLWTGNSRKKPKNTPALILEVST